jgi:hypothetical protein
VSVEEWGEYIAYGGDVIKVARSYRVYDEKGELVSTGMEWEEEEIKPGERPDDAINRARQRLDEKMKMIREEVARKYGGKRGAAPLSAV